MYRSSDMVRILETRLTNEFVIYGKDFIRVILLRSGNLGLSPQKELFRNLRICYTNMLNNLKRVYINEH